MEIEVFKNYYSEEKNELNKELLEFNKELVDETNPILKENLEYFSNLNHNGKLVRGMLVDLGYFLLNDNRSYSRKLALAYEIFQTAILVHDDIIDKDDKRRGIETIHYINSNKYNDNHFGNSIAICMGDYGLYKANKVIIENYSNDNNFSNVLNYFNDTVINTIRGEILDVVLPVISKNKSIDNNLLEDSVMNIYRLKTAHYTIIGPLSTGLILAGCDKTKLDEIYNFGEKIGIAFQIQDDILGIYSDNIGKVVGSDIKEFKQTILYSYIAKTEYLEELEKYYGKDIDEESITKVRELFKVSGSLDYATNMMNDLYNEGINIINNIDWIEENKKSILKGFVEYLRNRNK